MRSLTHTIDSLKLIEFLKDYPCQWHSISKDKKTQKALDRCIALYPNKIQVSRYEGNVQPQVCYGHTPECNDANDRSFGEVCCCEDQINSEDYV